MTYVTLEEIRNAVARASASVSQLRRGSDLLQDHTINDDPSSITNVMLLHFCAFDSLELALTDKLAGVLRGFQREWGSCSELWRCNELWRAGQGPHTLTDTAAAPNNPSPHAARIVKRAEAARVGMEVLVEKGERVAPLVACASCL